VVVVDTVVKGEAVLLMEAVLRVELHMVMLICLVNMAVAVAMTPQGLPQLVVV
jgi:hypothetical protein